MLDLLQQVIGGHQQDFGHRAAQRADGDGQHDCRIQRQNHGFKMPEPHTEATVQTRRQAVRDCRARNQPRYP